MVIWQALWKRCETGRRLIEVLFPHVPWATEQNYFPSGLKRSGREGDNSRFRICGAISSPHTSNCLAESNCLMKAVDELSRVWKKVIVIQATIHAFSWRDWGNTWWRFMFYNMFVYYTYLCRFITGVQFPAGQDFFLFLTASERVLEPTQPPSLWTLENFPTDKAAWAWSWQLTSV